MTTVAPPSSSDIAEQAISFVFAVVMHIALLSTIVLGLLALIRLTLMKSSFLQFPHVDATASENGIEVTLRTIAFAMGLLVVFGSRAAGVSFVNLFGQALFVTAPIRFGLTGVLIPAGLGVLVAWYFFRVLKRGDARAVRVLILIGTLTLAQFTDVYAAAISSSGLALSPSFVPNITFILGLGSYAITARTDITSDETDYPP